MFAQAKTREVNVVHNPCKNMEAVFEQEYEKGEISGIYNFAKMPEVIVADISEEIKTREANLPLDEDEDNG